MILPSNDATAVFCDWLDVTAPPSEEWRIRADLGVLLSAAGFDKVCDDLYRVSGGTVKFVGNSRWFKVGVSGAAAAFLRVQGLWEGALALIGEGPHRVTRVDVAIDLPLDGADALDMLQSAYPNGRVRLTQRPVSVSKLLQTRDDGREAGTWYAGRRGSTEVSCRVYDKALESLDKRGEVIPPRTRCELTVNKGASPTLRDAAEPERLFWHYMSPAILERPPEVPSWDSGWAEGWVMERAEILPAQALKRRIEDSPELSALLELADSIGPMGRPMALRLIQEKFKGTPLAGSRAESGASSAVSGS